MDGSKLTNSSEVNHFTEEIREIRSTTTRSTARIVTKTFASGTAEREAALDLGRRLTPSGRVTDKCYDVAAFATKLRSLGATNHRNLIP